MCDCDMEICDFQDKNKFSLLESSEYTTQGGDSYRYEYVQCKICGIVWDLSIDLDSRKSERDIINREKLSPVLSRHYIDKFNPALPEKNTSPDKFAGIWKDKSGRVLKILKASDGTITADYIQQDGSYSIRRLLNGLRTSQNMPAKITGEILTIELGTPGLGPTLELTFTDSLSKPVLMPNTAMGLYDDWEDNLGVSWVMPLSEFVQTKSE